LAVGTAALVVTLGKALALDPPEGSKRPVHDPQIGESFQVPYRLTDTNHFLVRVRINGKGPFNFLVDSGAPALFISTDAAKKVGLNAAGSQFWTPIDRLDLEGGARLSHIKARVEDPFQLVGMNALGLPGATIDGILGFTILARFRLEIDPTKDRMTWVRLDYEPHDLPVPEQKPGEARNGPPEVQALGALGPLAKGLAFLMGRQPEEQQRPRGFLGLEWLERVDSGRTQVSIRVVLEGSPAARAGLQPGDVLLQIKGRAVNSVKAARAALGEVQASDKVPIVVARGSASGQRELKLELIAGDGL
jgi:hypothetical protein